MAKPKTTVTATTQATVSVSLSPRLLAQVRTQCVEHADLGKDIKQKQDRQKEIKSFVESAFVEHGEVDALMDGTDVNGIPVKMVCATRKTFNRKKFIAEGGDIALYDRCMEETPNNPYVRIGAEKESK